MSLDRNVLLSTCHKFLTLLFFCCCLHCYAVKRAENKEEQSVGSNVAQQLSPPGRSSLLHHHQPQPNRPRQEEDLSLVVRKRLPVNQLRLLSSPSTNLLQFCVSTYLTKWNIYIQTIILENKTTLLASIFNNRFSKCK